MRIATFTGIGFTSQNNASIKSISSIWSFADSSTLPSKYSWQISWVFLGATLERTEIIRDLRLGKFDVLVGINLLREGLDIPEVSLVAILDADKEGFLRSETSLIQTVGRAARNAEGRVVMYADKITRSMAVTIEETKRRREIQSKYNEENGIVPKTIVKEVRDSIETLKPADEEVVFGIAESEDEYEVQRIQPVDMFPFSKHVESVAVLNLK